jgi:hypothetical protein
LFAPLALALAGLFAFPGGKPQAVPTLYIENVEAKPDQSFASISVYANKEAQCGDFETIAFKRETA